MGHPSPRLEYFQLLLAHLLANGRLLLETKNEVRVERAQALQGRSDSVGQRRATSLPPANRLVTISRSACRKTHLRTLWRSSDRSATTRDDAHRIIDYVEGSSPEAQAAELLQERQGGANLPVGPHV